MSRPELREYDLERLEITYGHNPEVLGLIATLRELRDDVAEAIRWLEPDDRGFSCDRITHDAINTARGWLDAEPLEWIDGDDRAAPADDATDRDGRETNGPIDLNDIFPT